MDERRMKLALAAGVVLRIILWSVIPVTTDACTHYTSAKFIAENMRMPLFEHASGVDPFWYPPMFHLLSALVYRLTGMLELAPLLAGVGGLFAFDAFVRRFYPDLRLYSVTVLSFLPFHMYISGIGYMTGLIFLFSVLGFYFYFSYLESEKSADLIKTVVFMAAAGLCHYHGLVLSIAVLAHLTFHKWKPALLGLVFLLLLISPWYFRNYLAFGNPIWPLIFEGNMPHGKTDTYGGSGLVNFINPRTYLTTFLDFWIGAPNSGEDLWDNVETGISFFGPVFIFGFAAWAATVAALTYMIVYRHPSLMGFKHIGFVTLLFLVSIIPVGFNHLARVTVVFTPFIPVLIARGINELEFRYKDIGLAFMVLCLVGSAMSYGFVYSRIMDKYTPFYEMMKDKLPADAKVVMPFNEYECLYYTGLHCVRVRSFPNSVPYEVYENRELLREYDIDYVCCDRLYWDERPRRIRDFCTGFPKSTSVFRHVDGGLRGECFRII